MSHFNQKTINVHLNNDQGGGQTLFNSLLRFGLEHRNIKRAKLTPVESHKLVERVFKDDLAGIYNEIKQFRDGIKSLEIYTEQMASQMSLNGI